MLGAYLVPWLMCVLVNAEAQAIRFVCAMRICLWDVLRNSII